MRKSSSNVLVKKEKNKKKRIQAHLILDGKKINKNKTSKGDDRRKTDLSIVKVNAKTTPVNR
jgi:hypothetical protein